MNSSQPAGALPTHFGAVLAISVASLLAPHSSRRAYANSLPREIRINIGWNGQAYISSALSYPSHPRSYPTTLVDTLFAVLDRPPAKAWSIPTSYIPWLRANAALALREHTMLASSALLSTSSRHFTFPEQNRLFVEAFENAWKKPHTRLIYEPRNWPASPQTPTIRITITSRAGRSSRLLSGNPYPLLIPWIVDSGLQSESNYCTALTGIILKLIWPDGAPKVNRDRVMRQVISDSLLRSGLLDQLEALEVRNLHGDVVTAVEKRFHIISSRLDHNGEWDATLKAYEFPLNLTIKLHLSATGKSRRSFTSIRPFLRSIDRHIQRVRSLRSFVDYVRTRSDVRVDLLFHDDRSVDPLDEAHIRQALAEVGNRRGGSAVSEYLSVSTMLLIREGADDCPAKSSWIILPDRRMFLWRFTGDRVLKWKSERFETASVRDRGLYCGLVPWTTPDDSRKGWFASPSDR